jgi:hypothetical protein
MGKGILGGHEQEQEQHQACSNRLHRFPPKINLAHERAAAAEDFGANG